MNDLLAGCLVELRGLAVARGTRQDVARVNALEAALEAAQAEIECLREVIAEAKSRDV